MEKNTLEQLANDSEAPMTDGRLRKQLKRLSEVKSTQWRTALDGLMEEIAYLLHGHLADGENGTKRIVGGYTEYGAHSEVRLGGDALYHYQSMVVEKLYDGSCEWKPENTLVDQLKKIAGHLIANEAEKYRTQMKREDRDGYRSAGVSLDEARPEVNSLEDSGVTPRHLMWEAVCEAADGDAELERYVQAVGECKQLKEVRKTLGLKSGGCERLKKKLMRRVKKKLPIG